MPAGAAHVAFPAASRAQVQDFFLAALKAGGKIHGEPCQRDASGYYSAAVIDFDGNSIEAVFRPGFADEANKENVDARSMISHRTGSVNVRSVAASAPPKTIVSKAGSKAPSHVLATSTHALDTTKPNSNPSGDVLDTLINEARSTANVAKNLVNSLKGNASSSPPQPVPNASTGGGGEAIVGTLLGVAAGAALHYAFSNRSKDSNTDDNLKEHEFQPRRPSTTGRSMTGPAAIMRPEYSSNHSDYNGRTGAGYQRAIEPAPSAYTYSVRDDRDGQRTITMQDHDLSGRTTPQSDYASTIRPTSVRRMSVDSGFGHGPHHLEVASHASSKTSRHSKKSTNIPPPTSYRAPTALTVKSKTSVTSNPRSHSLSRLARSLSGRSQAAGGGEQARSRSQSRHSTSSHRSRRDDFDLIKDELEEAQTVLHVTESSHRTTGRPAPTSKANSRASSKHTSIRDREPAEYPLPPSRAATWAGSDGGKSSFVSARSKAHGRVDSPRTIIGRLNPQRGAGDDAKGTETASVVSKRKDLRDLDVSGREVRPEDSVSQVSVESRRSRRSRR